ncbi:MAG: radical SAM protein [Candidatus Omnitrophota bacterium]
MKTSRTNDTLSRVIPGLNYLDQLRLRAAAKGKLFCGPSSVYIDLTTACNINCHFCWNHSPLNRKKVFKKDIQLPFDVIKKIVDVSVGWKVNEILLSGDGEPTLHRHIARIISYVKDRPLKLFLATNATFPERLLPSVGRADHVFIDFSSPDKDHYGSFQSPRNKQLFDRVRGNIARLSCLASRLKKPRLTVAFIITRLNYPQIPATMALLGMLKVHDVAFRLVEVTPSTRPLALTREDKKKLQGIIEKTSRGRFPFLHNLRDVGLGLRDYHKSGFHFSRCFSGWFNLSVDVNQNVGICCHNERLRIGSLKTSGLREIWEGRKAAVLRKLCRDSFDLARPPFETECEWCHWAGFNRKIERILARA